MQTYTGREVEPGSKFRPTPLSLRQAVRPKRATSLLPGRARGGLNNTFRNIFLGVSGEPLGMRRGRAGLIDPQGFAFRTFCFPGTDDEKRQGKDKQWLPRLMTDAKKCSRHGGSVF